MESVNLKPGYISFDTFGLLEFESKIWKFCVFVSFELYSNVYLYIH